MELYDIEPQEFYIESKKLKGNSYHFTLIPVNKPTRCPVCGSSNIIQHGKGKRDIRDTSIHGNLVGFTIMTHRYLCKSCSASFGEHFESVGDDERLTKRLKTFLQEESLRKPFNTIANELGLTDTTVRKIFLEYAAEKEAERIIETPMVLGIDENHLCNHYRAVFIDVEKKTLIEMLPNRLKVNVIKFIKSLDNYETTIKCVTCDMYKGYREAAYETIPNVVVIVDKFHVIQKLTEALDKIRILLKQEIDKDEYGYLKKSRGLMLSNSEDLEYKQALKLKKMFENYPIFEKPYLLKEEFREIYLLSKDRHDAEMRYEIWKNKAKSYPMYASVINSVDNWHKEIFNYFDYQYTNAATESINKLINDVANQGRGYSFNVLRLKCIYGIKTAKKETYSFKDFEDDEE